MAIVFYPSKLYTAYAVRASMSLRSGLLLYEIHELEPQVSSADCQSPIGSFQFPLLDLYPVDIFLFSSLSCFYFPGISISIPTCKLLCDWRLCAQWVWFLIWHWKRKEAPVPALMSRFLSTRKARGVMGDESHGWDENECNKCTHNPFLVIE